MSSCIEWQKKGRFKTDATDFKTHQMSNLNCVISQIPKPREFDSLGSSHHTNKFVAHVQLLFFFDREVTKKNFEGRLQGHLSKKNIRLRSI
jgi:hypothetical protein